MSLNNLLSLTRKDFAVASLFRTSGRAGVRVPAASRPYLVASYFQDHLGAGKKDAKKGDQQLVLYCAQQRQAEQWVRDLSGFGVKAVLLPPWDTLPAERLTPDVEIIAARMKALAALEEGGTVVVVPARAALYSVPRPEEGIHRVVTMRVGESHDLEALAERLVRLGFIREIRVEQQGQFAVRGGIVDLYPPLAEQPIRVEFFGDAVESIRSFDPITQVSTGEAEDLELTSLREVWVDQERGRRAADLLRGQLAAHKWLVHDVERLEAGESFDGIEAYLPFLFGVRGTVSDYLRPEAAVIVDEPKLFADEAVRILREEGSYVQEAAAAQAIPTPPEPYLPLLSEVSVDSLVLAYAEGDGAGPAREIQIKLLDKACSAAKSCVNLYSIAPARKDDFSESIETGPADFTARDHETITNTIKGWLDKRYKVVFAASSPDSAQRLIDFLKSLEFPAVMLGDKLISQVSVGVGSLEHGFVWPGLDLVVVTQHDLFGSPSQRAARRSMVAGMDTGTLKPLRSLSELDTGDLIVHVNHGIGRFAGLTKREMGGSTKEYLSLEFHGADKLFLPVDSLDRITKYIGSGDEPALSKLGGHEWQKTKNKVRKSLRKLAINLVKLYAERSRATGHPFGADAPWQRELEESFPYQETPDQMRAIFDVKGDMETPRPMDRLVCGDVGYGKTEVALRAAFKAVMDHKQVLVLVPTTLLAQQHFNTFSERFEPFPINVELLSRFRTPAEQKKVIKAFSTGEVDIVVGTHRALSKDIKPKDLGLIIVDEEHRFGVGQKEQLREMRKHVDVLTLTATPIPRTLQMSLTGIRDLSIIETPPPDRQPILTMVGEYESTLVRAAIRREMAREGQIFYVHNRVQDIDKVAAKVASLVPEAKVRIAHGQMSERDLDHIMTDFKNRDFDILVCTVIIESGLDIPNANTLIVENADTFGLAQLYQLRGRVGRSGRRAYAYFLVAPGRELTFAAGERLKTMGELTMLGAGLKLAMKDLEIRGAGNLLGAEQHGHIAEVGFELYADLLKREVVQLQEAASSGALPKEVAADIAAGLAEAARGPMAGIADILERPEIRIDLPADAFIPESYIQEEILRIEAYGQIARIVGDDAAETVIAELRDRFGPPPSEVEELIGICRVRARAAALGLERISYIDPRGISGGKLLFHPVTMTKDMWDTLRDRFGRFEWKRLEKMMEFSDVEKENALERALKILDGMAELAQAAKATA